MINVSVCFRSNSHPYIYIYIYNSLLYIKYLVFSLLQHFKIIKIMVIFGFLKLQPFLCVSLELQTLTGNFTNSLFIEVVY